MTVVSVVVGEAMTGLAMAAVPAGFAMPDGTETAGGAARAGSDGGSEGAARADSGSSEGGAARAGSDGGGGRAE